jgi:hypothetical protein
MTVACANFMDDDGTSRYNLIQDWACPPLVNCGCSPPSTSNPCYCITTITTADPKFVLPGDADDAPSASFESNNYRLAQTSPAINSGDPNLSNATPG